MSHDFGEKFSAAAVALGWQNRHSSQDRLIQDPQNPEKLAGVEITLGRYAKVFTDFDELALVARAVKRLGAEKVGVQFHLERHGSGVDPTEISPEEDRVASAAMKELVSQLA